MSVALFNAIFMKSLTDGLILFNPKMARLSIVRKFRVISIQRNFHFADVSQIVLDPLFIRRGKDIIIDLFFR